MPSNFACLGFVRDPLDEEELFALLDRAFRVSRRLGVGLDGAHVHRWAGEDGSVLVLEVDADGGVVGVTPSFLGRPGVRLAGLRRVTVDVVTATVLGPDGEPVGDLALDLEERRFVDTHEGAVDASVVALGGSVTASEGAASSGPSGVRSSGLSPVAGATSSRAQLSGTVLAVRERRNELTGLPYRVARVRTVLGEVDVALAASGPGSVPAPGVGAVLAGEVHLVGSVPALLPT